jgi:hypothetical protein
VDGLPSDFLLSPSKTSRTQSSQSVPTASVSQMASRQTGRRQRSTSPMEAPPRKKAIVNIEIPGPLRLPAWVAACLAKEVSFLLPTEPKPLSNEAQKWYGHLDDAGVYFSNQAEKHHNPMLKEKYADLKQASYSLRAKAQVMVQGIKNASPDKVGPMTNSEKDQKKTYEALREDYAELRESCEHLIIAISKVYKLCKLHGCPCRSQASPRADAKWYQTIPSFRTGSQSLPGLLRFPNGQR